MIRNYKVLGIAFAAILALGAFMAQAASASPLTTESIANGTVWTTGSQEVGTKIKFTAPSHGGAVECTELHYLGSGAVVNGAVNEQTVSQSYPTKTKAGTANCTAFGFEAHITAEGCNFTFTTPTKLKAGEVTWNAEQAHLVCDPGKNIIITPTAFGISVCTQNIFSQTPTGGHTVGTNITDNGKMAVTLNTTVTGIHYTGNGGPCGTAGVTTTDGTLTGSANVTCFSDEARTTQTGCTFS